MIAFLHCIRAGSSFLSITVLVRRSSPFGSPLFLFGHSVLQQEFDGEKQGEKKWKCDKCSDWNLGAPARVGLVVPIDVVVPSGSTGLDPSQTSLFQVVAVTVGLVSVAVGIDIPVFYESQIDSAVKSCTLLLNFTLLSVSSLIQLPNTDIQDMPQDVMALCLVFGRINFLAFLRLDFRILSVYEF
ncbi:60S acidic ribosomal protein P0-like [Senna tora]|uniref:60S acidic ribosomal protein P0-like n=1 Tax=Senna tora TaxID=362788 RepID=A0A834WHE1_9FABA|nr:60S acidic ribosomal protein P0-like [Senna tora]